MTASMSDPDLRHLADRLRARHLELRAAIRDQFADHDDPGSMALRNRLEDTDDWAVADAMAGFDIAMVSRDVAEMGEVERALKRLADGSYGRCSDCDETIPTARLHAYPAAARCIRCQEAFERRAAQTAGPAY
jgi:DnaK suppressor protein